MRKGKSVYASMGKALERTSYGARALEVVRGGGELALSLQGFLDGESGVTHLFRQTVKI